MVVLNPAALAVEIREYCGAHADAAGAAKYARYFKEGYDAWGLADGKHEFWNAKREEWLKRYAKLGLKGFLRAGELLFRSGKHEEGGMAIRLVKSFGAEVDAAALPGLERWFAAGIGNWAHVDALCAEVLGPALGAGRVRLKELAGWRESKFRFQRRAAPVAMLNLLKGKFKARELLQFVRPLMMDEERVVQQGMGWFLRELWKKDRAPVEAFLLEWKDRAPRLIFQYATEKMDAEEKARFRRTGKRG
ncbi:MAG: DNA alkylation repair protein [Candidatus Solibacter usitatus]|nr:DNA alkylation repair protein [Candidatus Solibacter usitatus]